MKAWLKKPSVVFWGCVFVLWLNFSGHLLSTLPLKKYLDGEFFSERFVFSRLVYNLKHGEDAQGGFMLRYDHVDDLYKSVDRDDYALFKERLEKGDDKIARVYTSHYGLQDDLMMPVWRGLERVKDKVLETARPGSRWHKRLQTLDYYYYNLISQTLVALVNALVLGSILFWVAKQFSARHAWVVLGLILVFQPVLTFYGRSMWWMMWSWFLPFAIVLFLAYRFGSYRNNMSLSLSLITAVLAGLAVCVRTLMGYEYVSPTMVGAMVPIVFYAVYQRWGLASWFLTSFIVGLGCLIGALSAMYMHYNALQDFGFNPRDVFEYSYQVRAYGGEATSAVTGEIAESVVAPFWQVLGGYLVSPKELAPPQILFMLPCFIWMWGYFKKGGRRQISDDRRRLYDAFLASAGVSFFGAVSMLVILKGHAYIHGYDIIIWSLPLNIILLIFYSVLMLGLKNTHHARAE